MNTRYTFTGLKFMHSPVLMWSHIFSVTI